MFTHTTYLARFFGGPATRRTLAANAQVTLVAVTYGIRSRAQERADHHGKPARNHKPQRPRKLQHQLRTGAAGTCAGRIGIQRLRHLRGEAALRRMRAADAEDADGQNA